MQTETFGLFGIAVLIIFIFAETPGRAILGVFASILLLLMGAWLVAEPLTFKTADHTTGTEELVQNQTVVGAVTLTNAITTYNISKNATYTPPSNPVFMPISYSGLVGLALLLISMFGMLYYGLRVGEDLNGKPR